MVDITIVFMGFINQQTSLGGTILHILWKIKNAPNHQPVHGYNMTAGWTIGHGHHGTSAQQADVAPGPAAYGRCFWIWLVDLGREISGREWINHGLIMDYFWKGIVFPPLFQVFVLRMLETSWELLMDSMDSDGFWCGHSIYAHGCW